jgi:hypothetical protein
MRKVMRVDSHNSLLTNREMAILSARIDEAAITAAQTMRYSDILGYFNIAEHYYIKGLPLVSERIMQEIDGTKEKPGGVRAQIYRLKELIDKRLRNSTI